VRFFSLVLSLFYTRSVKSFFRAFLRRVGIYARKWERGRGGRAGERRASTGEKASLSRSGERVSTGLKRRAVEFSRRGFLGSRLGL